MSKTETRSTAGGGTYQSFEPTHWSLVLAAVDEHLPGAQAALEQLCSGYWYPLYAFLRRTGHSPADAQDLTQGFFVHLLARGRLRNVHPAKGKFRSFLLACLKNYVQNERAKEHAIKRGGGDIPVAIVITQAEQHYGLEPADVRDPARIFERRWASTLIERVLCQLKENCINTGKGNLFEILHPFLTGDAGHGGYAEPARRLGMTENAVRQIVHRLRGGYRELLRAEVGRTVASSAEIDEEIKYLFSIFHQT